MMGKFVGYLLCSVLSLAAVTLSGCCDRCDIPAAEGGVGGRIDIHGTWVWTNSTGGAVESHATPQSEGFSTTVVFRPDGTYQEEIASDSIVAGVYKFRTGALFGEEEVDRPILKLERPLFAGWFDPEVRFAITTQADTLEITGIGTHAWTHTFIRLPEERR